MKAVDADLLEEIRRLNVVLHEDEHTITAVSPCPDKDHRGFDGEVRYAIVDKVACTSLVTFACPHGSTNEVAFCEEHAMQRREAAEAGGRWSHSCSVETGIGFCPDGSTVVRSRSLFPVTREKA